MLIMIANEFSHTPIININLFESTRLKNLPFCYSFVIFNTFMSHLFCLDEHFEYFCVIYAYKLKAEIIKKMKNEKN